VKLGSFFRDKPVALILNYYSCPMLCGLLLNGVRDSLQRIPWKPGDHYKVVVISIDPKEDSDLAMAKKHSLLQSLPAGSRAAAEAHWHFLVGRSGSEARVARAVGFRYKWIPAEKQWAHGAALFLLSPTGKLSRVLFGLDFPERDLKLALLEAGEGKVGTLAEKLALFCYHYDPKDNKYALLAARLVSLGGAVTVVALLLAYGWWFFRSRRKGNTCSAP
jgi:protein SCO1/2